MKYERFTERVDSGFVSELDCRIAYNKLSAMEDKIEQGTLIELPCPIGTMVYYIGSYKKKIGFWGKWKYCYKIMEFPFTLEMLDAYGNNWFLSREEAEKRIKELQNG